MTVTPTELTNVVVETVSDARGIPIEELPPLAEAVDIDAVAALISASTTDPKAVTITFSYAGLCLSVSPGAVVHVQTNPSDWGNPGTRKQSHVP